MNKFILLTIIFATSYKAAWANPTTVEIREHNGGLDTTDNALLAVIDQTPTGAADAEHANKAVTNKGTCSTCVGKDATITFTSASSGASVTAIRVTNAGSGYKAGDTIIVAQSQYSGSADLEITLTLDQINNGGLDGAATFATNDLSAGVADATAGTYSNLATTSNGAGVGALVTVVVAANTVPTVTVVKAGRGYAVGNTLVIAQNLITGSTAGPMTITLAAADINFGGGLAGTPELRYPKTHVDDSFFNSIGANMPWDETTPTLTGYYVPLSKPTNYISVVASFSAGTVQPQIGSDSDQTLVDGEASTLLSVKDGLNVLKLVSSEDGTYEIYLVKPESQIKEITTSKRNILISYTPAAVGEFTCSAFDGTNSFTDPTDREEVKTLSGVVAKSTRTNNILVKDMFKSVQLTLNGLTPSTAHEIHCYHAAHGIISKGSQITTQLASLTGVSLLAGTLTGGSSPATLTLTFTHEINLVATNTIKLKLYNGYDGVQAISTDTNCKNLVEVRSGGPSGDILSQDDCTDSGNELIITLAAGAISPVSSASSGTQIVIVMTHQSTELVFAVNAPTNTEVLFDLEVSGHGKILKQYAYKTT